MEIKFLSIICLDVASSFYSAVSRASNLIACPLTKNASAAIQYEEARWHNIKNISVTLLYIQCNKETFTYKQTFGLYVNLKGFSRFTKLMAYPLARPSLGGGPTSVTSDGQIYYLLDTALYFWKQQYLVLKLSPSQSHSRAMQYQVPTLPKEYSCAW